MIVSFKECCLCQIDFCKFNSFLHFVFPDAPQERYTAPPRQPSPPPPAEPEPEPEPAAPAPSGGGDEGGRYVALYDYTAADDDEVS